MEWNNLFEASLNSEYILSSWERELQVKADGNNNLISENLELFCLWEMNYVLSLKWQIIQKIREITNVFGGVGLKVRSVISLNKNDVVTLAYIIILITSY